MGADRRVPTTTTHPADHPNHIKRGQCNVNRQSGILHTTPLVAWCWQFKQVFEVNRENTIMIHLSRLFPLLLATSIVAVGSAGATETAVAEKDPLRAVLADSKEKNRGVTIYTRGSAIAMVVTGLDERYVMGRSQQATRIVIRIDHIDGVAGVL